MALASVGTLEGVADTTAAPDSDSITIDEIGREDGGIRVGRDSIRLSAPDGTMLELAVTDDGTLETRTSEDGDWIGGVSLADGSDHTLESLLSWPRLPGVTVRYVKEEDTGGMLGKRDTHHLVVEYTAADGTTQQITTDDGTDSTPVATQIGAADFGGLISAVHSGPPELDPQVLEDAYALMRTSERGSAVAGAIEEGVATGEHGLLGLGGLEIRVVANEEFDDQFSVFGDSIYLTDASSGILFVRESATHSPDELATSLMRGSASYMANIGADEVQGFSPDNSPLFMLVDIGVNASLDAMHGAAPDTVETRTARILGIMAVSQYELETGVPVDERHFYGFREDGSLRTFDEIETAIEENAQWQEDVLDD